MLDDIPPPWREMAKGAAFAILLGIVGRLMHHSRQVQLCRRQFWSLSLIWEVPVDVGTGIVGRALADYLGSSAGRRRRPSPLSPIWGRASSRRLSGASWIGWLL